MAEYQKHLYMIVFPINALVSSQLGPEAFAHHYTYGSGKHYKGKVLFAEIDVNFRDPYFPIDEYLEKTVPHPDGGPKRTKYISSYRVLEHVPLNVIQKLYAVTTDGLALGLDPVAYTAENAPGLIRMYQEIAPLTNLVAAKLDQRSFGTYITQKSVAKGAPKICFTQLELDVEKFMADNSNRDVYISPIPENNPYRLMECLKELKQSPEKAVKTVSLSTVFSDISFRLIRHGFWFFDQEGNMVFFRLPKMEEIADIHPKWVAHAK